MPEVTRYEEIEWRVGGAGTHRGGKAHMGTLLVGDPASPGNYALTINRTGDQLGKSPRHRHDFDQIRFPLEGPHSYAPDAEVPVGWVGYFPEGVPYGPFEQYPEREYVLLQFGGPSGNGFVPYAQWRAAGEALAESGTFAGGFYEADGRPRRQDALEAILEHARGRPVVYPAGRYQAPVVLNPEAFAWLPVAGAHGVRTRALATFTERGTAVDEVRLEPGATFTIPVDDRTRLWFLYRGEAVVAGTAIEERSAFSVRPGEDDVVLGCDPDRAEGAELLVMSLPRLDDAG